MINKTAEADMHVITVTTGPVDEFIISAQAREGSGLRAVFERVIGVINESEAVPVAQKVFGRTDRRALEELCEMADWPITCLAVDRGSALPSTQVYAIRGTAVKYLHQWGRSVASVFEKDTARWCRIGGLVPSKGSASPEEQARASFEQLLSVIEDAEMGLDDLVRTWFFLDDILSWYGDFNEVRNDFFTRHGVFSGLIPASTGIGTPNISGGALTAEALLIHGDSERTRPKAVASPAQCAATKYGSSFSRAVEVAEPEHRRVYISGTASLDQQGRTVRRGDFEGQMDVTLKAVEKILNSRTMNWENTVRAIAYAPRAEDMPALRRKLNPLEIPVAVVPAVVCRDDLLFELELDAIRATSEEPSEKARDTQGRTVSNLCGE